MIHVINKSNRQTSQPITCQLAVGSSLTEDQSNPGLLIWNNVEYFSFEHFYSFTYNPDKEDNPGSVGQDDSLSELFIK